MVFNTHGSGSPTYHRVNLVLETHDGYAMPTSRNNYCAPCIRAVKWLPVLFILVIISWSYYAYVVELCFITIDSYVERILFLFFYHIALCTFLWAYWQTVFTDIGRVPRQFKLPIELLQRFEAADEEEQSRLLNDFAQNLPLENCALGGGVRYCDKCQHVKPDRSHHCGVCRVCVLKMDHHCPWVNNCVGFTNYKFFILFLFYALLYCVYVFCSTMPYFIQFWKGNSAGGSKFHILFLFFVAVMFAISLLSLFGYHCYLVLKNRSTLESFRAPVFRLGPDKNGFSLGSYNNFVEVFGNSRKLWFLPVFTSMGDGVVYPTQLHTATMNYAAVAEP